MKKIIILTITFLLIVLSGCNGDVKYSLYTISFEKEIIRKVYVEKEINEVMRPDFVSKIDDKILVLSGISDTMVHEYNLDMSYIRSWGNKGIGPDEIANFPMFCKGDSQDETLYLWGFSPVTIRKYSKNEGDIFVKDKDIILPYYEAFNFMSISKDSIFYYYDVNNLLIKKIFLNSLKEESINFEKDIDNDRSSAFYSNRGTMDVNSEYIVYAYMYKNQIDIYDKESMSLKKRYITEINGLDTDQYDLIRYYTNVVITDKYIYAYKVDNHRRHLLEIYDFDGNPIMKNILDKPIPLFAVDESNKSIIGFNFNDEDSSFIYKFPEL
ncbi:BF3164 family lipoprotein [Dysgonomonas reticulitermitis]